MNQAMCRVWVALGIVCLVAVGTACGRTIYVDDDAADGNDGTTWEQAYRDLQSALDVAQTGDEIRVAGGTYRPSKGERVAVDSRYASFSLISGVAIRGGFAGATEPDPTERDVTRFESILSGDLSGDDVDGRNEDDNLFHVVTGDNTDPTAILDGFTIERGRDEAGGGLTIYRGSPTIVACTFRRNHANGWGGAVMNYEGNGAFIDCTFVENTASFAGGALAVHAGAPRFTGCVFSRNTVDRFCYGGAVYIRSQSHSEFMRCRFVTNLATWGGAVRLEQSTAVFQNCLFAGNRACYYRFSSLPAVSRTAGATQLEAAGAATIGLPDLLTRRGGDGVGGAISCIGASSLSLHSCTVADNSADICGGISSGGDCSSRLVNCILWDNNDILGAGVNRTPQIRGGAIVASYCCVQRPIDNLPGMGNFDIDPAFARPGRWADPNDPTQDSYPRYMDAQWIDGDYHLRSQGGRWDPNTAGWVADEVNSPCIDSGDPNSPIGHEPEPNGGRINRGVYGGTSEASKSR